MRGKDESETWGSEVLVTEDSWMGIEGSKGEIVGGG